MADDDFEVLFSFTKRLSDFYGVYSNVANTSSNFTSVSTISISFLVRYDAVDPTFLISSRMTLVLETVFAENLR